MRGFQFESPIDPNNPKDPNDPPPMGWDTEIDTSDYRKALFGFPSPLFEKCREWEERELRRLGYRTELKNGKDTAHLGMVYTRAIVKIEEPVTL